VFYVSATNFTSTGSDCNTACKYLEAAPVAQSTWIAWATTTANCYSLNSSTGNQDCQKNSIYSGTGQTAKMTASEAIGMGMSNTVAIVARHDAATPSVSKALYAAGLAESYSVNGKTDWHLPSRLELNQLCRYAGNQPVDNSATTCGVAIGVVKTGFETGRLWNSSEAALDGASNTNFFSLMVFASTDFGQVFRSRTRSMFARCGRLGRLVRGCFGFAAVVLGATSIYFCTIVYLVF
jgi:hypothetical protein